MPFHFRWFLIRGGAICAIAVLKKEMKQPIVGLATQLRTDRGGRGGSRGSDPTGDGETPASGGGGASDDIGDVSWNVSTVVLRTHRTCPEVPGTIGLMQSRWPHPSHTRARPPGRRSRP
jgi:hypothetical protein